MNKPTKPLIFYSHASDDKAIVERLQAFIARIFQDHFRAFNSSDLVSIYAGAPWRRAVRENLEEAQCVLVLLTPISINRNWVMYEAGACWFATETRSKLLIPCLYEVNDVPSVMSETQAINLRDAVGVRRLVETLKLSVPFTLTSNIEELIHNYITEELKYPYVAPEPTPSATDAVEQLILLLAQYYRTNDKAVEGTSVAQYLKDHDALTTSQQTTFNKALVARRGS